MEDLDIPVTMSSDRYYVFNSMDHILLNIKPDNGDLQLVEESTGRMLTTSTNALNYDSDSNEMSKRMRESYVNIIN